MKNLVAATLLVFSSSAFAGIEDGMDGILECATKSKAKTTISFMASRLLSYGVEAGRPLNALVNDAKMVIIYTNLDRQVVTEIGRRATIVADQNYKPKKYTNHMRFDLNQLVNIEDFGDFAPVDSCKAQLLIPHDAGINKRFQSIVQMSCDSSGSTHVLNCKLTPKKYGF